MSTSTWRFSGVAVALAVALLAGIYASFGSASAQEGTPDDGNVNVSDGEVNASATTTVLLDPSAVELQPAGTSTLDVVVQDIPEDSGGLAAYDLALAWDPDVINVTDISGGDEPFDGDPFAANIDPDAGTATFNDILGSGAATGTVVVDRMSIEATCSEGGASTDIQVTVDGLTDADTGADFPNVTVGSQITCVAAAGASFTLSPGSPVDAGTTVDFTDTSSGPPTSWEWDLDGDGTVDSTDQNPSMTYETADTYTASLTASNDLGASSTSTDLVVEPGPVQSVEVTPGSASLGTGQTLDFDAEGTDAFGNVIPGGGAPSAADMHELSCGWSLTTSEDIGEIDPDTGEFTASTSTDLIGETFTDAIQAACDFKGATENGTASVTFQAAAAPVASFDVDWDDADSDGEIDAGEDVMFTDTSSGPPTSWEWDLDGNGTTDTTAQNVTNTYDTPGSYTVTLTVSNDLGSDAASSTVEIAPGALNNVELTPADVTLEIGGTQQFDAVGTDQFGNEIAGLSFDFVAATTDGGNPIGGISVIDDDSAELTAGTTAGVWEDGVTASATDASGASASGNAHVAIEPDPLDTVEITPGSVTLEIGETASLAATGFDAHGNDVGDAITDWEWSLTNDIGDLDPATGSTTEITAGETAGDFPGIVEAQGSFKGASQIGTADVQILAGPLASLSILRDGEPTSSVVASPGEEIDLDPQGMDEFGNVIPASSAAPDTFSCSWEVTDSGAGSIDPETGEFTAGSGSDSFPDAISLTCSYRDAEMTATADVQIVGFTAVGDMSIGMGDDRAPYVEVGVQEILDSTGEPAELDGGIGGYQACVTYDPDLVNVMDVAGVSPFGSPVSNIQNDAGRTCFNGFVSGDGPGAPAGLARLHVRLIGPAVGAGAGEPSLTLTAADFAITEAATGNSGGMDEDVVSELGRGDARADGEENISDAMYIAQTILGLRPVGEDPEDNGHAVNAASVRPDGVKDVLNVADAMFIAQRLAGLRDEFYE